MDLPFQESDLVGPEDRPTGEWELSVYGWRAVAKPLIKQYLDQMDGTCIRALQAAVRQPEGRIYLRACDPQAPKAHRVSLNARQRVAYFSLYTALKSLHFPRVGKGHKLVLQCRPEIYGETRLLVVMIKEYRVEKVDRYDQEEGGGAESPPQSA